MKKFLTKKLFYGEYLYKVVINNDLANIFRGELQKKGYLSYAREEIDQLIETERLSPNGPLTIKKFRSVVEVSKSEYEKAKKIYWLLKYNKDYKLSVTFRYSLSIYSNNLGLIKDLIKLKPSEYHEPDHSRMHQYQPNIILVDREPDLPIKVTLGTRKVDPGFVNWHYNNADKCRIGVKALECIRRGGYQSGLYFYVRDEKVLNLITMLCGDNIRKVEKLVYKHS